MWKQAWCCVCIRQTERQVTCGSTGPSSSGCSSIVVACYWLTQKSSTSALAYPRSVPCRTTQSEHRGLHGHVHCEAAAARPATLHAAVHCAPCLHPHVLPCNPRTRGIAPGSCGVPCCGSAMPQRNTTAWPLGKLAPTKCQSKYEATQAWICRTERRAPGKTAAQPSKPMAGGGVRSHLCEVRQGPDVVGVEVCYDEHVNDFGEPPRAGQKPELREAAVVPAQGAVCSLSHCLSQSGWCGCTPCCGAGCYTQRFSCTARGVALRVLAPRGVEAHKVVQRHACTSSLEGP